MTKPFASRNLRTRRPWTIDEERLLLELYANKVPWSLILGHFEGRSRPACQTRLHVLAGRKVCKGNGSRGRLSVDATEHALSRPWLSPAGERLVAQMSRPLEGDRRW